MKKLTRISAALFCAVAVVSGAALSANAVSVSCVPDCNSLGSCVITPNGCNTFDTGDLQSVLNQCSSGNCNVQGLMNQCSNGNCDVQSIIDQCGSGNCNIQDIISRCGLLPDSKQCTDSGSSAETPQASVPTAPATSTAPSVTPQPTTSETTGTQTPVITDNSVSEYEKQVVELVNSYRAQYGLNPVTLNTELSKVARLKSQDMKDKGYFSHTSPTYGSPFDMMKQFGISYRTAGENIAMGQRTPEAVMEAWMNSEGHRANILNASYTQIGVGYVADGNYWTQMFIG